MEVVALGLFTFNLRGLDGAMFQMLSHGFVSVALFPCVGVLYGREHTHEIATFGAPTNRMPRYASSWRSQSPAWASQPPQASSAGFWCSPARYT
jgi:NADH-quinone oxidoreductase subunit M